jgi:hypothetical protein
LTASSIIVISLLHQNQNRSLPNYSTRHSWLVSIFQIIIPSPAMKISGCKTFPSELYVKTNSGVRNTSFGCNVIFRRIRIYTRKNT